MQHTARPLHRKARKQPELSIAPLIDIIFLLLIFFMVTTTFAKREGIAVKKPKAEMAEQLDNQSLAVTIDEKGRVYADDKEIDTAELGALVKQHVTTQAEASVIVEADARADVGVLVKVLDTCKKAGAQRLAIGAKQLPRAGSGGAAAPAKAVP